MRVLVLILISGLVWGCTKKPEKTGEAPAATASAEVEKKAESECQLTCDGDYSELCGGLISDEVTCDAKLDEASCAGFVDKFGQVLTKKTRCRNSCHEGAFETIVAQMCDAQYDDAAGAKILERATKTLVKLNFEAADKLILTRDFKRSLKGPLAEAIMPEINKRKK